MTGMGTAHRAMHSFFDAVESGDLDAVAGCFTTDASYGNVPHEPARGRDGIRAMFAPIISRSTDIEWQIITEVQTADLAIAERVDRFRIDGQVYAIECMGIYRVDAKTGLLAEVRDYVDVGVWRARLGGVLDAQGAR